jgi:hypothetical protein
MTTLARTAPDSTRMHTIHTELQPKSSSRQGQARGRWAPNHVAVHVAVHDHSSSLLAEGWHVGAKKKGPRGALHQQRDIAWRHSHSVAMRDMISPHMSLISELRPNSKRTLPQSSTSFHIRGQKGWGATCLSLPPAKLRLKIRPRKRAKIRPMPL